MEKKHSLKISKITGALFVVSVVAVALNLFRGHISDRFSVLYLAWNLLLAWIPYFISTHFIEKNISTKRFIAVFIPWLIFFPNAPYLVTDVFHIASKMPFPIWYDSILFFLFGWIGILLAVISLFQVNEYLCAHTRFLTSEIIIFGICLISSFGVYIGRFLRWNSWDIFVRPFNLVNNSPVLPLKTVHNFTPLIFTLVFSVFLYAVYKTMHIILAERISQ